MDENKFKSQLGELVFSFTFFNDTYSIASCVRKQKDFNPDLVVTLSKGRVFDLIMLFIEITRTT